LLLTCLKDKPNAPMWAVGLTERRIVAVIAIWTFLVNLRITLYK
jgi:hypothetical protein